MFYFLINLLDLVNSLVNMKHLAKLVNVSYFQLFPRHGVDEVESMSLKYIWVCHSIKAISKNVHTCLRCYHFIKYLFPLIKGIYWAWYIKKKCCWEFHLCSFHIFNWIILEWCFDYVYSQWGEEIISSCSHFWKFYNEEELQITALHKQLL